MGRARWGDDGPLSRAIALEPRMVQPDAGEVIHPTAVAPQTFEPRVSMGLARTTAQIDQAIYEHDQHKELIKLEVVPAFDPEGNRCYRFIIWTLPWP